MRYIITFSRQQEKTNFYQPNYIDVIKLLRAGTAGR